MDLLPAPRAPRGTQSAPLGMVEPALRVSCRRLAPLLLAAALLLAACSEARSGQPVSQAPGLGSASGVQTGSSAQGSIVFAVIGDYGTDDENEERVADLVASWEPDFIVTTGDCYYSEAGGEGAGMYDDSTGDYYGDWIGGDGPPDPATGEVEGNAFFPALGNHDYSDAKPSPDTYLDYFDLPGAGFTSSSGNERFYDFVYGPVHFFVLNSNPEEPDGTDVASMQARWLKRQLADSTSAFDVVVAHHPPYSSDLNHGPSERMQWAFDEWGADVVLSGHAHTYERIERDGTVYFVNGLGGASRYRFRPRSVEGSKVRFREEWGAQRVTVAEDTLVFEFYAVDGTLVDRRVIASD